MKTAKRSRSIFKKPVTDDVLAADFGDPRLVCRLVAVMESLSRTPESTLPKAIRNNAAREGAYRFLNNARVDLASILEPHFAATARRMEGVETVYVVHDTTEFRFTGETPRRGLGPLGTGGQGFFGHFSLAVESGVVPIPLGLLALGTHVRNEKLGPVKKTRETRRDPNRESLRWGDQIRNVREVISTHPVIHLADREADIYQLLAELAIANERFIIRVAQNRKTSDSDQSLFEALSNAEAISDDRTVPLSSRGEKRPPVQRRIHPVRSPRMANLRFAAKRITTGRPNGAPQTLPKLLELNYVHVFEVDPPDGADPVDWKLVTTESVDSPEEILAIVDGYRTRWLVEEYFKALKTGCAFEKSQMETRATLENYLAVLAPIAWRLLLVRNFSRSDPSLPATAALTRLEIEVLRKMSDNKRLRADLSLGEAMLAIATWGGYAKSKRPPGWQSLGGGFEQLGHYVDAWAVARGLRTCD